MSNKFLLSTIVVSMVGLTSSANSQDVQALTSASVAQPNQIAFVKIPDNNSPQKIHSVNSSYNELFSRIQESCRVCQTSKKYNAVLEKQVKVGKYVCDPESIEIKFRDEPYSVYMHWPADGKKALYVDGENDGRVLAKPTGILGRRRVWKLTPDSSIAMKGCRYPVTEIGLRKLSARIQDYYEEVSPEGIARCQKVETQLDGRDVEIFKIEFKSQKESRDYACSQIVFDKAGRYIVAVENCEWTPDGKRGDMVEKYHYRNIDTSVAFSDSDFVLED